VVVGKIENKYSTRTVQVSKLCFLSGFWWRSVGSVGMGYVLWPAENQWENVPIVVVENKEDLIDREENSTVAIIRDGDKSMVWTKLCVYFLTFIFSFLNSKGIIIYSCSANTGENVEEAFRSLAEQGMQWLEHAIMNNLFGRQDCPNHVLFVTAEFRHEWINNYNKFIPLLAVLLSSLMLGGEWLSVSGSPWV